jgi:hypothetical protein|nr:hypothetical protein [uncultured Ralstonia sp.]
MTPDQQLEYRKGALAARDFLLRSQAELFLKRRFNPQVLRMEYGRLSKLVPPERRAGFLDAIGAYVLTTLEGVLVDLHNWDILSELTWDKYK